jgi:hypothetical protein
MRMGSAEDRAVVWVVAFLGAVIIGLFVGLLGVSSLLLVLLWGTIFGAIVVVPSLITWHARDSVRGRPGGQVVIVLLRYVWPVGIAAWLARKVRALPRRLQIVSVSAALVPAMTVVCLALFDRDVLHAGLGLLSLLLGGIVSGAVVGAGLAALVDVVRLLRRPRAR